MICVTHEMGFARQVADRVIFMDDGRILEQGSPEHFFENPENPRCRDFLAKIRIRARGCKCDIRRNSCGLPATGPVSPPRSFAPGADGRCPSRRSVLRGLVATAALAGAGVLAGCGAGVGSETRRCAGGRPWLQARRHQGAWEAERGREEGRSRIRILRPRRPHHVGMEIDLCYQIAAAVFDVTYDEARRARTCLLHRRHAQDPPVRSSTRTISSTWCARPTPSPERIESWDFSTPYRTDYVGLMVKKRSGFTRVADLGGRSRCEPGRDHQGLIEQMLQGRGYRCAYRVLAFSGYPVVKSSLDAGDLDFFRHGPLHWPIHERDGRAARA